MDNVINVQVNIDKLILSSETRVYKTESFFYQTKKVLKIDSFVLNIAQSLQQKIDELKALYNNKNKNFNCYKVETIDKSFSFTFMLGFQIHNLDSLNEKDIVFIDSAFAGEEIRSNDNRILNFISRIKIFNVNIYPYEINFERCDLSKIYIISSSDFVNFPMLSASQQKIVEIENKNVLVQGVAGSGKTNICISKIIFSACKFYSGKILYTTFSRGLLVDTKNKIELFKNNISNFLSQYKLNKIIFLDRNHKKAIENYLGVNITSSGDENLIKSLDRIVDFLNSHVDYYLIDDLYGIYNYNYKISDEEEFVTGFLPNITDHQLKARLEKINHISYSIIYKEIYGMIFGYYESDRQMMDLNEYKKLREGSFTDAECEIIYALAKGYSDYKKTQNLTDNNEISYYLLQNNEKIKKYSLSILDEVQDFTRVNLNLFKQISIKVFAVGDALQMINPSYFNFSYLKKLLYVEGITEVAQLENNYRNNKKIVDMLEDLSEINRLQFGTHNFLIDAKSIDQNSLTTAVCTFDKKFIDKLSSQKFEDFTIIVSDKEQKDALREKFKKQEILTVSEIKGLERETVLLYNLISSNSSKWLMLEHKKVNHKIADENSIFRYYFNLFYVGISRAKHNIFVFEEEKINLFEDFFKKHFDVCSAGDTFKTFSSVVSTFEIDEDEIISRIDEFIKLGQFDNAKFYADKLSDGTLSSIQSEKIEIYKYFVFRNKNREAGIKLWQIGLIQEAKKQFLISGDSALIEFMENLETKNQSNLDPSIVKFFLDFKDNKVARDLIIEVLNTDINLFNDRHKDIKQKLYQLKERKHGK